MQSNLLFHDFGHVYKIRCAQGNGVFLISTALFSAIYLS